jgi:hypothetical protein
VEGEKAGFTKGKIEGEQEARESAYSEALENCRAAYEQEMDDANARHARMAMRLATTSAIEMAPRREAKMRTTVGKPSTSRPYNPSPIQTTEQDDTYISVMWT